MRMFGTILLALCLAATTAEAKPVQKKKKKSGAYDAAGFIKTKETKAPAIGTKDEVKASATTVAGMNVNCTAAETSPTEQQAPAEKTVGEAPVDAASTTNSTQKALEMAKTVVKTVKDNCRTGKNGKSQKDGAISTIEPDVGVQVVNPGDLGVKESKGERPELSGTVGVNATF